jgi:hypothetical protein
MCETASIKMDISWRWTDEVSITQLPLLKSAKHFEKTGLEDIEIWIENIRTVFYWVCGTSFEDSVSMMTKEITMKIWNTLKIN